MASFGDKLRCPNCLEELEYLQEPKVLPCSHVFCLPCLEGLAVNTKSETRKEQGVQPNPAAPKESGDVEVVFKCSICSALHTTVNMSTLPGYVTDLTVEDGCGDAPEEPSSKRLRASCDKCKNGDTAAECYCVECDKKLCQRHLELHQEFFCEPDQQHQIITIQHYLNKQDFYVKPMCNQHNKEYAFSCRQCFCLKCAQCAVDSKCEGGNIDHFFKSLKDISSQLKAEFEELMKKCSVESAKLCKLEKEVWTDLDELDDFCQNSINDVMEGFTETIAKLEKERDIALQKIEDYRERKRSEGEGFYLSLQTQRESLDGLRANNDRFIRGSHTVKIIEEHKDRLDTLQKALSTTKPLSVDFDDYEHIQDYLFEFGRMAVSFIPSSLVFITSVPTGNKTYSVLFNRNNEVLVSCDMGLQQYSLYKNKTWPHQRHVVTSACANPNCGGPGNQGRGETLFVRKDGADLKTVYELQLRGKPTEHFNFSFPGTQHSCVDSSKNLIAATSQTAIELYNVDDKKKKTHELGYQPTYLSFLSPIQLVVSDQENDMVHMYSLSDPTELKLMWTCDQITGADGLCTTNTGFILVRSKTEAQLYVLSDQGVLLKTLRDGSLPTGGGGICVKDDRLAVACTQQDKFTVFRIKPSGL